MKMNPASPADIATDAAPSTTEEIAALRKELAAIQAENSAMAAKLLLAESAKDADLAEETLIVARMQLGLKRPQAVAAVRRQRAFDESDYGKAVRARHEARQNFSAAAI